MSDRDKACTPHDRRIDFQMEMKNVVLGNEDGENRHESYDPLDENPLYVEPAIDPKQNTLQKELINRKNFDDKLRLL